MTLYIFKCRLGWYWRLVARNGKKRAIGGEPFSSARVARRSFNDMHAWLCISTVPTAPHKRVPIGNKLVRVVVVPARERVRVERAPRGTRG